MSAWTSNRESQRGMVLIAVLWAIAFCSVLAMAASVTFRSLAGVLAIDRDRLQADELLSAGLEVGAGMAAVVKDAPLITRETVLTLPTGSVRVRVSDETGRIDFGKAPVEVIESLLRYVGAEADDADVLSRRIVALRKAERPQRPADGAARPATGRPAQPQRPAQSQPTQSPFTDVRQVAIVPGMRPEWFAAMLPLTTVYGSEGVNSLTAPIAVLRALPFFEEARLDGFLQMRREPMADDQQLPLLLGRTGKYLKTQQRQVVSVDLVASTTDGLSASAQGFIVLLPGDKQPYRVLAWNPGTQRSGRDGFARQEDAE
jgi:general secretion pathway protein K